MKKLVSLSIAAAIFILHSPIFAQNKADRVDTLTHTTFYSCPKHPNTAKHEPGTCSICGMTLQQTTKEKMKASSSRIYTCPVHLEVTNHEAGKCPKCGKKLNLSAKEQMKTEVTKTYTCSMHPEVSLTKNGTCPKCGKSLIEKQKATQE